MSDQIHQLDRLRAVLVDPYRIEREVALKVLKPELAAVLGADRFVQQLETTARRTRPCHAE